MRNLANILFIVVSISVVALGSAVEVRRLEFNEISFSGSDRWYESSVEIEVSRDVDDRLRKDADFLDDLDVELFLGIEIREEGRPQFEFYRSVAQLVSLERGEHVVRFYLPPEVVKRDLVKGEPHSFLVRLSRNGELLEEVVSDRLERPQVKQSFIARATKDGQRNEGVLKTQDMTPFSSEYPRSTPSLKRAHGQIALEQSKGAGK